MNSGVARDPVAITKMPRCFSPSTPTSARNSSSTAIVEGIGPKIAEFADELLFGFDPVEIDVQPPTPQFALRDLGVRFDVFDHHDSEQWHRTLIHARARTARGGG